MAVPLFSGARRNWRFVAKFIAFSLAFWLVQFAYQFYLVIPGEIVASAIRSFGFAGATFISLSLLSSVIFKWKPDYKKYWHVRRSLGVAGFVFTFLHVWSVINFVAQGNLALLYPTFNPFDNPLVFGAIAYAILFVMALTSTDWAVSELGFARWKTVHRLVYFAFLAMVMHFLTVNPAALMNLAGYLLMVITFLVIAGELYWFVNMARGSSVKAKAAGLFVILLWIVVIYLVFFA